MDIVAAILGAIFGLSCALFLITLGWAILQLLGVGALVACIVFVVLVTAFIFLKGE